MNSFSDVVNAALYDVKVNRAVIRGVKVSDISEADAWDAFNDMKASDLLWVLSQADERLTEEGRMG